MTSTRTACPEHDLFHLAAKLRLLDARTGVRMVTLLPTVVEAFLALPRIEGDLGVIVSLKPGAQLIDPQHPWRRIRARAAWRMCAFMTCGTRYATIALALGETLTMIGKLLGHTQVQRTARYAHLARETVKVSTARIGDSIEQDLHLSKVAPPGG